MKQYDFSNLSRRELERKIKSLEGQEKNFEKMSTSKKFDDRFRKEAHATLVDIRAELWQAKLALRKLKKQS